MVENNIQICVITATYNSMETLPALVDSLKNQTVKNFKWIVADGDSDDGTLDYLKGVNGVDLTLTSQKDFGVYDALNRAISLCSEKYYLVVGSDDLLYSDALEKYQDSVIDDPDLVFSRLHINGNEVAPRKGKGWLYGMRGQGGCHSVGTLIKKALHDRIGMYSKLYPVCADQLFIGKCFKEEIFAKFTVFLAGEFSTEGLSGSQCLSVLTENYRLQLELGYAKSIQTALFFMRIMKNFKNI